MASAHQGDAPETTGSPETARPVPAYAADAFDDRLALFLAFFGSACLLILEIVAGRLLAPTLGVSLYTWTAVIGVVLAGVGLGNYLGGRLADLRPSRSTVALIYVAGSLASLAVLGLAHYVDSLQLPSGAPAILQVLWLTALLFFVPSTIIAAATPVLTRLSLHRVSEGGRVVGRIQAAAALGSILGTFLTGFLLISSFGTRRVVAGVAVTLLVLAVAARPPWLRRRAYELAALAVVIVASGWVSSSGCTQESNYYCIRVQDVRVAAVQGGRTQVQSGRFRALYLDRVQHSVSDLTDPTVLYYPYEQLYAQTLRRLHPAPGPVDAFFIGGGGYTFPRWLEHDYRGRIVVSEVDPAVTSTAYRSFGLDRSSRIRTVNRDARRTLRELPRGERFDAIVGDAFSDVEVPYHLTTRQFNDLVAAHLEPDGVYMLNVVDGADYDFLRSVLRTLRVTFPYVTVLRNPQATWPPSGGAGTAILAAKSKPKSLPEVVPQRGIDAFLRDGHSVLLTDDHVPVDQLLAPVFRQSLNG
jgi:spermidine synthase